jgi:hypothetical protein
MRGDVVEHVLDQAVDLATKSHVARPKEARPLPPGSDRSSRFSRVRSSGFMQGQWVG